MENGLFDVRLTAEDASGNPPAQVTRTYQVQEDLKVGIFTLSFNDLTIPVAGIPITVIRTYDSRVKTKGDFGDGWTLSIKDIEISESGKLGEDWEETLSSGFFPTYALQPTKPHFVTVTYPDGQTDEFNLVVDPSRQLLDRIEFTTASFVAAPGTFSRLESLDDNDLLVQGFIPGPVVLYVNDILSPNTIYDPNRYRLTRRDGTVFIINQQTGIEQIQDLNGNTITFGLNGIIHSSGKSITFIRDAQGRIETITDPEGNAIDYGYDFYGDLVSVTDREENVTQFTYNFRHDLIDIIDPRGVTGAKNEYKDGRLIATVDAYGNRIVFTHEIDARREVVRDRMENITEYTYDDDGNVLTQTQYLEDGTPLTTTFTYDDRGNVETETNPEGNLTKFTYDDRDNQ